MAESIRFDFLSTGADKLAGDFKKTGDSAGLAARGAKVLQDAIEKLGQKEDRTAAESALLAKALKQTGDAEDRAAAKALAAEVAIGRLDEALQKEERDALEAAVANRALGDSFDKLAEKAGGPSLKGALAALSPALLPLAGGLAAGVAAVGVSFGAAAIGAGLFATAAKSVLSDASSNLKKLQTLELAANTARTAAAKKAAQQQIAALKASWSAGYLDMLNALDGFKSKWTSVSQAIAVPALTAWLRTLVDALDFIKPAVLPVAAVFTQWGQTLDKYFTSQAGSAEVTRLATAFGRFSASQLKDIGGFIVDIGRGVFNLAQDLAGHNIDFGTFGKHLAEWGAAFARWSASSAARQDVSKFLAYLRGNGPVVAGLLKNIGGVLSAFAPGLSSVGTLELKLVSDFLGILAKTPKAIAKPLIDVAGALLLLQKTGVLSVGIKIVGPALKWLTGGVINIGGGAAVGAEIRAAFTSGGAAAAAEIRAALAGGGAAGGAGGIGGGAAAGATAGKAAGGGFLAAFRAAVTPASAGVIVGALIRALGDTLSPAGTFAGNLNKQFQADGHLWSTTLLHSFTFGGLEAWLTAKIGLPVGNALNNIGKFVTGSWGKTQNFLTGSWDKTSQLAGSIWGGITGTVSKAWGAIAGSSQSGSKAVSNAFGAAGRAADGLRTRNLTPLLGEAGKVSGGIQGLAGTITGRLNPAVNSGGSHVNAFRTQNLGPLQGSLSKTSGGVQGLQHYINLLHGKTVSVGVHGAGSGGAKITVSSVGGGAFAGKLVAISNRAAGGHITGPGGPKADKAGVFALSNNEFVMQASATGKYGVPAMKAVNAGRAVIGFASGGLVTPSPDVWGSRVEGSYGADSKGAFGAVAASVYKAVISSVSKGLQAQLAAAAGNINYKPGAGVGQWAGVVRQALAMEHLNPNYILDVLYQMQTESGGNPNAINLTDINAQHGTPSKGLMQVIAPTFARWHWPGTSGNIYDPLANIAAALNYAAHGRGFGTGPGQIGSGHGYDKGGWLMPGATLAINNTGRPEQVIPPGGSAAGGVHLHLTVNGPIGSQQQLEDWFVKTANKTAQHGRLRQAVRAANR